MNQSTNHYTKRAILNQLKYSSLSGNKEGLFSAYGSESEDHIRKKFEVWLKLKRQGWEVWCEAIFKSGIRPDILAFKDGIWINYEILSNETIQELNKKIIKYPPEITTISIRTPKDITHLETL